MRVMTEEEIEMAVLKHTRRRETFQREGLSSDMAWELADKMWERDLDIGDKRRLCFECKKYDTKEKTCEKLIDGRGKPQRPPRFTLMNCVWFDLRGANK
jgi:hypothetical protein